MLKCRIERERVMTIDDTLIAKISRELVENGGEFANLIANACALHVNGNINDDERVAWITFLVGTLVTAELMHGTKLKPALHGIDNDQAQIAVDGLTAEIMSIIGQQEMAELFLENRPEFDRRCKVGRRWVDIMKGPTPLPGGA